MKIKLEKKSYQEVLSLPKPEHIKPKRPNLFFRGLLKTLSKSELRATHFTYKEIHMEKLHQDEPCLILMNHSSFIDLKIATTLFASRPLNIVCTSDGFVGKEWLMRNLGCIPTQKFVMDVTLLRDMRYVIQTLKDSVLMYPEASYSFDGTATPLPKSVGKCLKLLNVPVIMVRTQGAFLRDPLYNNLQPRKVEISAEVEYLLSPKEIQTKSAEELNEILEKQFTFDHFLWQQQNHIQIGEPFRADYLNRVLYKCPSCKCEGRMLGKGTTLTCQACHKVYELTEYGFLQARKGETEFNHIPDWYKWQRQCVKEEIISGTYELELPVKICMMVDTKAIYEVGEGILKHSKEGFHLVGCHGELDYKQKPQVSYSLYADYYWYEIGDVICIGNQQVLYYCFPTIERDVVAKARLATEELYKWIKEK